jgi:hypothetical protein
VSEREGKREENGEQNILFALGFEFVQIVLHDSETGLNHRKAMTKQLFGSKEIGERFSDSTTQRKSEKESEQQEEAAVRTENNASAYF